MSWGGVKEYIMNYMFACEGPGHVYPYTLNVLKTFHLPSRKPHQTRLTGCSGRLINPVESWWSPVGCCSTWLSRQCEHLRHRVIEHEPAWVVLKGLLQVGDRLRLVCSTSFYFTPCLNQISSLSLVPCYVQSSVLCGIMRLTGCSLVSLMNKSVPQGQKNQTQTKLWTTEHNMKQQTLSIIVLYMSCCCT